MMQAFLDTLHIEAQPAECSHPWKEMGLCINAMEDSLAKMWVQKESVSIFCAPSMLVIVQSSLIVM